MWKMITVSITEISVILFLVGRTPIRPPPDYPQAPLWSLEGGGESDICSQSSSYCYKFIISFCTVGGCLTHKEKNRKNRCTSSFFFSFWVCESYLWLFLKLYEGEYILTAYCKSLSLSLSPPPPLSLSLSLSHTHTHTHTHAHTRYMYSLSHFHTQTHTYLFRLFISVPVIPKPTPHPLWGKKKERWFIFFYCHTQTPTLPCRQSNRKTLTVETSGTLQPKYDCLAVVT